MTQDLTAITNGLVRPADRSSWTNWHQNVKQKITNLFDIKNPRTTGNRLTSSSFKKTTANIQAVIAAAQKDNIRVRAIGGKWSFSRVATTDGWVLETGQLNQFSRVLSGSLLSTYQPRKNDLFLVQCGVKISKLNILLETKLGRSLKTTGASNGQTFAGAMSTGTHGSAIGVGPIQEHVLGLHLITSPDRHIWLERASNPVVSKAFIDKTEAELVRDDTLFSAALVSFGSFGFIHAVMIETTKPFLLEAYRKKMPFNAALKSAVNTLNFTGLSLPDSTKRPYFFQIVVNPYDPKDAYVTTMYKRPVPADYKPKYGITGGQGPGYDVAGFIGVLNDHIPALTPLLVNQLAKIQLKPFGPRTKTLGETFHYTTPRSHSVGAALGVELANTSRVLEKLLELDKKIGPSPLIFACRFVQHSDALLAFTRYKPTCVVDLDGVVSKRSTRFFKAAWETLENEGIPFTQHWGKINNMNARQVRKMYGSDVDQWSASRQTLLGTAKDRWTFSNSFLERLGLAQ